MGQFRSIPEQFEAIARRFPERVAVTMPGRGSRTYRELDQLANRVRDGLVARGVARGDRVGICLPKSIDAVASILGAMKAGAAYVPVDVTAPARRGAFILHDCDVAVAIADQGFAAALNEHDESDARLPLLAVADSGDGAGLAAALEQHEGKPGSTVSVGPDDVAYILYTSGSTGTPKGVTLTHLNAASFVGWCAQVFQPVPDDTFSSHAPFHFDLSILDLYVPLTHGARLVLIDSDRGKEPKGLAQLIGEERITVWYSTPSVLSLLVEFGNLAGIDTSALRTILFAGEVFPIGHLRGLVEVVPHARYFNLYGPTETNVCTFHEIPVPIPAEQGAPFPIGAVCSHVEGRVVDPDGATVHSGTPGELCITGAGVMRGYWNRPDRDAQVFLTDPDGTRWYRTGDIVVDIGGGVFDFRGRRDRMVKKRGYRIELGEIEAGLYRHPDVQEAAVVAIENSRGVEVVAFLVPRTDQKISVLQLKQFCARELPAYMAPDRFRFDGPLPKTSTDKVDYQRLTSLATA